MAKQRIIAREIPLAEITLRKYEKPSKLSERELVRKLCLSLGLLQPGDSRDIIVDVLHVLVKARRQHHELPTEDIEKQVIEARKRQKLPLHGIASSNIGRQIRRLRELFLIEKRPRGYRITEFEPFSKIFEDRIEKFYLASILPRVKEYCDALK